jgi:hypothetical protein
MTTPRDPDRLIHAFVREGAEQLDDQVYDAVRAEIDQKRQRVVIGPWRVPTMSKLVPIGLGAAAVIAVLFIGSQFMGSPTSNVGGAPSAEPTATPSPTSVGGTVQYHLDGAPATTVVDAVADGTSVSGTAVTTFVGGTHTVRVECAARDGDTWAFGGTIEQTTVPGEGAGGWSLVDVRDGSPPQIGIWLSADKSEGADCDGWLAAIGLADIDPAEFVPVESGELVPPPDLAP